MVCVWGGGEAMGGRGRWEGGGSCLVAEVMAGGVVALFLWTAIQLGTVGDDLGGVPRDGRDKQ